MTIAFCYHEWVLADDMLQSAYVERLRCTKCQHYGYTKEDPLRVHVALYTEQGKTNQLREFKRQNETAVRRHDLDKCVCPACAERRARLNASDKSIKVTHVAEIPKQRVRSFIERPSGDTVSMIRRGLTNLGVKAIVLFTIACGVHAPHPKPPTAVEACERAVTCGAAELDNKEACEFCVECFLSINSAQVSETVAKFRAESCDRVTEAFKWVEIPECVRDWQRGSRCGNKGMKTWAW